MRTYTHLVRPALAGLALLVAAVAAPRPVLAQCTSNPNGVRCFGSDLSGAGSANSTAARTAFLSSLINVGTENFEALTGTAPFVLNFSGAGTATVTGAGAAILDADRTGAFATSGTQYIGGFSSQGGATTLNIAFGSTVGAFGFFGTDIGDVGSQLTLRFTLAGGLGTVDYLLPYTAASNRNASRLYAGVIDTRGFTSVQFLGTDSDDFFGFDDMTIGSLQQVQITATPEPSTVVLLALGLAALLATARRRRHA